MIHRFIKTLPIFLLFLGLLYSFIPFETSNPSLSMKIRAFTAMLIMLYALIQNKLKVRVNTMGKLIMIFSLIIIIANGIISFSTLIFLFAVALLFGFIVASIIQNNDTFKQKFLLAFGWLIYISIFSFILQFIVFYLFGNLLDLHSFVFPLSEGRIGIQTLFGDLYRLGGIYIEPGTYANYLYLFLLIYLFISKDITSPILFIGAITIILSYSVWGMAFGSYFLIMLIFLKLKNTSWLSRIILLILLVSVSIYNIDLVIESSAAEFATDKVSSDNESTLSKKLTLQYFQNNLEDFLLLGEGFAPKFDMKIQSVQDAGLLVNISMAMGILFTIVIFSSYVYLCIKWKLLSVLMLSLPIFVSKVYYWDFSFWLFFFLVIFESNSRTKKKKDSNEVSL